MMKILMAIVLWFPFSIPKDTTPKIVFVNKTQEAVVKNIGANNGKIKVTTGKELTARIKVRLIIPDIKKHAKIARAKKQ